MKMKWLKVAPELQDNFAQPEILLTSAKEELQHSLQTEKQIMSNGRVSEPLLTCFVL